MPDEQVSQYRPSFPGEQPTQIHLDLLGRVLSGEAEQGAQALHMGIHDHTLIDAKRIPEDDVGRFATNPRKALKLHHGTRNHSPCRSTTPRANPMMFLALFLKKPVDRMISSTSSCLAPANSSGVVKRSKRTGVTMFTRSSVHCAERIVATPR